MSSITEAVELTLLLLRIVGDSWPIAFMVVALYLIGTLRRMHGQAMERQECAAAQARIDAKDGRKLVVVKGDQ